MVRYFPISYRYLALSALILHFNGGNSGCPVLASGNRNTPPGDWQHIILHSGCGEDGRSVDTRPGARPQKSGRRFMTCWKMVFCRSLLFLLLFAAVAAAPAFAAKPELAWNHTYRLENDSQGTSVVAVDDGYVVTGWLASDEGGKALLLKTDLAGRFVWQKTFCGHAEAYGNIILKTDYGFLIAGETYSPASRSGDIYMVKTGPSGSEQWNGTYGGAGDDQCYAVWQTGDGGYVVTGRTYLPGRNDTDIYLLKVDKDGREQWSKTFGGDRNDWGKSVQQTGDGGYVVAGVSESYGSCYLLKTDGSGNEQWNRTYGPASLGLVAAVRQTLDGGYLLAGSTSLSGQGNSDAYLVKTDPEGDEQWNQTYGGAAYDTGSGVWQTDDGGYLLAGSSASYGNGTGEAYLVKTGENGSVQWSATYGAFPGIYGDSALRLTGDGGCIIVGSTTSYHQIYGRLLTSDKSIYQDLSLLKLDKVTSSVPARPTGIVGGSVAIGESRPVAATGDGFVVAGSISFVGGREPKYGNYMAFDVYPYLLKTDTLGNTVWMKVYDKVDTLGYTGEINSVAATSDGYLLAGSTAKSYDSRILLLKTDPDGNALWKKTYGNPNSNYRVKLVTAVSDGYVMAGTGTGVFLMKTNLDGDVLWFHNIATPGNDQIRALIAVKDGYLVLIRSMPEWERLSIYLYKADLNGTPAWNVSRNVTGYTEGWSVAAVKDGYAVSGQSWIPHPYPGSGPYGAYLFKTDLNGGLRWEKEYFVSGKSDSGEAIVAVKDGYVMAGTADAIPAGTGQTHLFLLKTDPDGNREWNVTFTGSADNAVSGLLNLSDGYIIVGQNNIEGKSGKANQSLHMIRTDMSGNVVWDKEYADFDIPAVSTQPAPDQVFIVTSTPVPAATPVANVTPAQAFSPSTPAAPSQMPGFSALISSIALLIGSLAMLERSLDRKGGDRS